MQGNPSFRITQNKCKKARKCSNCYFIENRIESWSRCRKFSFEYTCLDGLCDEWVRSQPLDLLKAQMNQFVNDGMLIGAPATFQVTWINQDRHEHTTTLRVDDGR